MRCSRSSSARSAGYDRRPRTASRSSPSAGCATASASRSSTRTSTSTVCRGEILGVVGGSGTGKSVLMRSIIGLQTPDEGEIEVLGENMIGRDRGRSQEHPPPLGHPVPERRPVLDPDRRRECRSPDPRIFPVSSSRRCSTRSRRYKIAMGGPAAGRRPEISVRAVGRHGQARRPRPGAGARSRAAVPRRADRRASTRSPRRRSTS